MLNKVEWYGRSWFRIVRVLREGLEYSSYETTSVKDILRLNAKATKLLTKGIRGIELYLLDLYCLEVKGVPAFLLESSEFSYKHKGIKGIIGRSSISVIECITSSLYGNTLGTQQVDYLIKWSDMNLTVLGGLWEEYEIDACSTLRSKVPIEHIDKVRASYLKRLHILNENKFVDIGDIKRLKSGKERLISSLLND